jgi:murein DD-endopeptidase MepM/ murein hydrolase activator NlpD
LNIEKSIYKIEKINGLPEKMVTPGPEFYKKINKDRALIKKSMNEKYIVDEFPLTFIKPTEGRISGIYGSQRILNGVKKNPHGGLDIAASEGTPIRATAKGKIVLATKGLYYTGNIVIIDHGYDIKSMYIHMKDISIKTGDVVEQGQTIGTVGSTGRSTGPHLHWNIYWNKVRINPEHLLTISK